MKFLILFATLVSAHEMFGAEPAFDVRLDSLSNHNSSASPNYDQSHFPANFGTKSLVSKTQRIEIDPAKTDMSMNPVTPGHVSRMDVHTLIPSRPDLRWFAHLMTWWGNGFPFNIGVDCDTADYAKALVTDLMNRGFNGVIIDGADANPKSRPNRVARRIQTYLKTLPPHSFTFIVMVDNVRSWAKNKTSPQQDLQEVVEYCKTNYFSDPNYEREEGKPILMFFHVRKNFGSALGEAQGAAAMAAVKSATGGNMVWITASMKYIDEAWADQIFGWVMDYPDGVNPDDPYHLSTDKWFCDTISKHPQKKAFGAMVAGFNGTLTRSTDWSLGHYLPRGSGACLIQRAQLLNTIIPRNVTRMQWATWNDWAEGSAVEAGIENDVTVTATVQESTLSWTVTSGTGDET
ncbi:MAG: hypothetical protein PHD76_14480, partial [Methylacidiphilales bacterium]|nr:hypothetical protein [Candidatus Methylacidiphilales bacterium]